MEILFKNYPGVPNKYPRLRTIVEECAISYQILVRSTQSIMGCFQISGLLTKVKLDQCDLHLTQKLCYDVCVQSSIFSNYLHLTFYLVLWGMREGKTF